MKKILVLFSLIVLIVLCTFSANAAFSVEENRYVEDENTKIIDHVVYELFTPYYGGEAYYGVAAWFDTYEASQTVEEINIVSEIDGIEVTGLRHYTSRGGYHWVNYTAKKINIPDTIKYLGLTCFSNLDGVEELTIPASVKTIEYDSDTDTGLSYTFKGMESLKKVTFLGDLKWLGGFQDCKKLETVVFKGSVESILTSAFENCTSLKSIDLPDTVRFIDDFAFRNSGLTSIEFPANVRHYFDEFGLVFKDCKDLVKITFAPSYRQSVGFPAGYFDGCTALEEIVFSGSYKSIYLYKGMFRDCSKLEKITFPTTCESLTIGDDAFRNCTSLKTVTLPEKSNSITIDYRAFRDCKNLTTVNNTDNITKIYGGAFRDCTSLKSFTISDKTTMIGKNAFYGCKNLKTVTVNSKTKAPKLYANVFAKTNSSLTFKAKNATAAKSWKSALNKSGLKTAKVGYMHYV